ncbi:MAG: response regulator transcription factor [Magnetococcales bacterium]|nr:response regulator transcription factor [Magnetococcales bacterium]
MTNRILIIEDEKDLLTALEYNLTREGFQVLTASCGEDGLLLAGGARPPDLVVLDLMLPGISGFEVCRRLRASKNVGTIPILMLSARSEDFDKVTGFECGTDDYVTKPFKVRELVLRIHALLRRAKPAGAAQSAPAMREFGLLKVDEEAHRVWVGSEEVSLTAMEFKLLLTFMERRGRVQNREGLLNDVWGIHAFVQSRTVDAHIKRLRDQLGEAGNYIETIRGVGYRFKEKPDDV